jgi:phage terminase small subunit
VQKTTNGYLQMGVWLQISNRAVEQMRSAASEFGMSPSARVRVNPCPQLDLFGDDDEDGNDKKGGKGKGKVTRAPKDYFT